MASILITDDSTFARLALRKMVPKLRPEWKVEECASPTEALAKMQMMHFDILLIDYHMPDMNGLSLAASLRKTRPDDLAIALVTANIQEKIKEKTQELGVEFVGKPVTEDKLAAFFDKVGT